METNPYAPPKAPVADPDVHSHGLKHRSVWLMLLFTVITFGLYYLIWFFRRRRGLNRLDSPIKLALWPLLLLTSLGVVQFGIGWVSGSTPVEEVIGLGATGVLTLYQWFVGILMVVQCFRIKDIIQDHATPPADPDERFVEHVQLSGLMTFFFSIFYLQWAINRYVVAMPVQRATARV